MFRVRNIDTCMHIAQLWKIALYKIFSTITESEIVRNNLWHTQHLWKAIWKLYEILSTSLMNSFNFSYHPAFDIFSLLLNHPLPTFIWTW